MPKLGYGYSLYPGSPSSQPSDISGLSLWLKADAGVDTTPQKFISQIVVSGAGTATSNGTYTRASGGFTEFTGPNGNTITLDEANGTSLFFFLYDSNLGTSAYGILINYTSIISISGSAGELPLPTASTTLSPTGNTIATAWADQSGNGRNATPIISPPAYVSSAINNKPAILFSDDELRCLSFPHTGFYPKTIFVIGTAFFDQQYKTMVGGNSDGVVGNYYVQTRAGITEPAFTLGNIDETSYVAFANALTANAPYLLGGYSDFLTNVNAFKNGVVGSSVAVSDVQRVLTTGYVGCGYYDGEPSDRWNGYIAEVIIYNRVLTTTERQQVEGYLNAKYAIY
jgi:hypothetical protein